MECPNCDFNGADELFGSPPQCPECDAYYAKALLTKQFKENQDPPDSPQPKPSLRDRVSSAKREVEEGSRRRAEQHVTDGKEKASRSVIITDIRIPFLSIVVLMVKFAIASIPAAMIIYFLIILAGGIVSQL